MRVKLIAHTTVVDSIPGYIPHAIFQHSADDLAEQAGRLCYESWSRPNPATATNAGYIENIIDQGHNSVMEHASATFYIDGVTRNFTHELVRHRHLSYSEVSQRYVSVGDYDFIEHPGIQIIDDKSRAAIEVAVEVAREAYGLIIKDLTENQSLGRKQARQAARHILPSGFETKILVTGNMHAWRYVLSKRLPPVADEEFRRVARLILSELKRIAPNTFQDFDDPAS